ncbi:MAG: PEP-CTERM sorting domain-containing protein, partial [Akkermansia sp.]|nr:PEP-CTERM sorting domain-containing protein [Akkermansia sp.]
VAEGATLELSLSDVMVSGSSAGISLEGSGNISLNTENLAYTFVVTNEMLAAGGEHTFTLMEGSGSVIDNTYSSMIQSGVDINFVLEDGTAFIPETISGLEILFLEDAEVSGPIVIGPNGGIIMPTSSKQAIVVKATIPEPATATLSLLALAALAARRRRR